MITEILWHPTLGFPAYVAQSYSKTSSSSYPFDQGQHYLLQVLNMGLCVEFEAMWKDKWRHNITIIGDHHKQHDMDWVFGFHLVKTVSSSSDPERDCSQLRKKQSMVDWRRWLSLFKSFAAWYFFLSFMACDKNWLFLIPMQWIYIYCNEYYKFVNRHVDLKISTSDIKNSICFIFNNKML